MGGTMIARLAARPRRAAHPGLGDQGFSLVELLIAVILIPIIMGAVAVAVIAGLQATSGTDPHGTSVRLADSHDAQNTSAQFVQDLQSAQYISTNKSDSLCPTNGTKGQLVGLQWKDPSGTTYNVSYDAVQLSATSPSVIQRRLCKGATETDAITSHNVFVPNPPPDCTASVCTPPYPVASVAYSPCPALAPTATDCATAAGETGYAAVSVICADGNNNCANGVSHSAPLVMRPTAAQITAGAIGVKTATISIQENQSGYQYALTATPRVWNGVGSQQAAPPTPPFILEGANPMLGVGQCGFIVNGIAAVDNSNDNSISIGSTGKPGSGLQATGVYTTDTKNPNGAVKGPTSKWPQPPLSGQPILDPYASLAAPKLAAVPPAWPAPDPTSNSSFGAGSYNTYYLPTNYKFPNGVNSLNPGIYVINGGTVTMDGRASIQMATVGGQSGVLFYAVNGGSINLAGGASVTMTPLQNWENTALPEPVIWLDKTDTSGTISIGGTSGATAILGAIYAPNSAINTNGGGNLNVTALVANSVSCSGGGSPPDLIVGSPLASGTTVQPSSQAVSPVATPVTATITIAGAGQLAFSGTVRIYVCGPQAVATGCAVSGAPFQTINNVSGTGQTSVTSNGFTPSAAGSWCFSASYTPSSSTSYNASSDTSTDGCFTATNTPPPPNPDIQQPTAKCYQVSASGPCASWPGGTTQIQGTASDPSGPGLNSVTVEIYDLVTKMWWNGTAFSSASPTPNMATMASAGWATWTYSFPQGNFPNDGDYTIYVASTDSGGLNSLPDVVTVTWNG
jgi:prepilin-type N-terminal cleavage/methylation domain-containing protein